MVALGDCVRVLVLLDSMLQDTRQQMSARQRAERLEALAFDSSWHPYSAFRSRSTLDRSREEEQQHRDDPSQLGHPPGARGTCSRHVRWWHHAAQQALRAFKSLREHNKMTIWSLVRRGEQLWTRPIRR